MKFQYVRVTGCGKKIEKNNPISGHSWTEYGEIKVWEVRGPFGVCSKHRSEAKAVKQAAEWEAFYIAHPPAFHKDNA